MKIVLDMQARQSYGSHHRGIGRYALALSRAMVQQAGQHDIHLLVNAAIPGYVQEIRQDFQGLVSPSHIHAFSIPTPTMGLHPENAWRIRAAEHIRETFLLNLQPDIVHISSLFEGLDDDIVTSVSYPELAKNTSVSLHDLIPLVQADPYLRDQRVRGWYYRKLQSLKNAGLVLSVSDYSRQEGIDLLGLDPERVFTVYNAVADDFRPLELLSERISQLQAQFGIGRAFILYIGGVEHRKNIDNLIAAYARLDAGLRMQYQLVIAGKLKDYERERLGKIAQKNGLSAADMVLTGAIADTELIALYNMAALFVFPSLYEGFGLPALEAMACGCPTIVADNSSLPEVVGWQEATFDATSVDAISHKLRQGLQDEGFRQTLRDKGREQVEKFSWDASARRALDIFEAHHDRQQAGNVFHFSGIGGGNSKSRLAFVCSTPPARLLSALAHDYEIEIITDQAVDADAWVQSNFPLRSRQWLRDHAGRYQRRVYVISPEHCDRGLLALMRHQPGSVILYALPDSVPVVEWLDAAMGVMVTDVAVSGLVAAHYGKDNAAYWVKLSAVDTGQALCLSRVHGEAYCRATEQFHVHHPLAHEQHLLDAISVMAAPVPATDADWLAVARSVADNRPVCAGRLPVLFYDVSIFVWSDHATGVHRVTRHILEELFRNPPVGYRVEPIYARDGQYRYAHQLKHEILGLEKPSLQDTVVDFHAGDILLHVDLGLHIAVEMEQVLHYLRAKGVQIHYLIHDILVLQLPEAYFDKGVFKFFRRWLETISRVADGLICTTHTGMQDMAGWLQANPPQRYDQPRLGVCTLGADIQPASQETLSAQQAALLDKFRQQPSILMVSTIEPRKGYAQALKAFERLWAQGLDIHLVLVGKQGWNVDGLVAEIQNHPEQGKHLHWMKFVSNSMLSALYENCSALLMASEGEGFGLPLIEAAQHNLPVIARGIPVFREIAGEHAFYFEGKEPQALADAVQQWLVLRERGQTPKPAGIEWITWEESAEQIKAFLFGDSTQGDVAA